MLKCVTPTSRTKHSPSLFAKIGTVPWVRCCILACNNRFASWAGAVHVELSWSVRKQMRFSGTKQITLQMVLLSLLCHTIRTFFHLNTGRNEFYDLSTILGLGKDFSGEINERQKFCTTFVSVKISPQVIRR